jgi:hypothetical protein
MKTMKKYQTGAAVTGSKGAKASQIIAGISAAAAGAAGIGKNISNKRKAKKAAEEKAKMEAEGKMKYGGAKKMKKYQSGGMAVSVPGMKRNQAKAEEFYDKNPSVRTYTNEYTGKKIPTGPMTKDEYQNAAERAASVYPEMKGPRLKKGGSMKKMKTGGMVNSNSKVTALKSAGSKGVKSGVNTKVSASKVAKGRTGGTSSAPKTATPKAKMGGSMKKKSC